MTNHEMSKRLQVALENLQAVHAILNDEVRLCECCGMTQRTNYEDFQQKQELGAAIRRVEKALHKIKSGDWPGREIVEVVNASTIRSER